MEDKDSEQTVDQKLSTSPIDQITKVPVLKPKAKVKNPKRVAAGKKLSQYNKKAKEQQKLIQKEEDQFENQKRRDEVENDGGDQWLPKTSFSSIIALLGLGLTAIDLFLRYKSQRTVSNIDDYSINNSELVDREREISPNEVDIKKQEEVSKSFGGME